METLGLQHRDPSPPKGPLEDVDEIDVGQETRRSPLGKKDQITLCGI